MIKEFPFKINDLAVCINVNMRSRGYMIHKVTNIDEYCEWIEIEKDGNREWLNCSNFMKVNDTRITRYLYG